jgi:hypothetical protein
MIIVQIKDRGQTYKAHVVKFNSKRVKVRMVSEDHSRFPIGSIVNVPYSMVTSEDGKHPVTPDGVMDRMNFPNEEEKRQLAQCRIPETKEIDYRNPFFGWVERYLIRALVIVNDHLSPENLTCDGECSRAEVAVKSRVLKSQKRHIVAALGYDVDEWLAAEAVAYWIEQEKEIARK